MSQSLKLRVAGVVVLIAVIAGVWWLASAARVRTAASERPPARQDSSTPLHAERKVTNLAHAVAPHDTKPPSSAPDAPPGEGAADDAEMHGSWQNVDLDEVRKALPDNLYWQLSAPTKDPQVVEWREAERDRWNTEYGKVLSGTGSEEEIRAYYDYRARLSSDYVEFATYLLDHYGDQLPDQDVGLLKLARRLHLARLEEIPRKVEEALERKHQQDAAREAWLADQAEFGGGENDSP
jgi:hypothetical protein